MLLGGVIRLLSKARGMHMDVFAKEDMVDSAICHPLFLAPVIEDELKVCQWCVTACISMQIVCYFPGKARVWSLGIRGN